MSLGVHIWSVNRTRARSWSLSPTLPKAFSLALYSIVARAQDPLQKQQLEAQLQSDSVWSHLCSPAHPREDGMALREQLSLFPNRSSSQIPIP